LKPRRSRKIAKFVGSAAASGEIKELRGSIGDRREAKKMIALMAIAIGTTTTVRLIMKAIKTLFLSEFSFYLIKRISGLNFFSPLIRPLTSYLPND
jgi:hypothetical protein